MQWLQFSAQALQSQDALKTESLTHAIESLLTINASIVYDIGYFGVEAMGGIHLYSLSFATVRVQLEKEQFIGDYY
eukprot:5756749-Amphidinium_carterae.1